MIAPTATATERLRLFRSHHRIEIDNSPDWSRCDTDGITVYHVRTRRWQHDLSEVRKLELAAAREALDEGIATFGPPRKASRRCESGGHDFCTCDVCF